MDDDDVTTATAETNAVNNITSKINPNNSNSNRPPRLFMASITEEQSRRSLFNDYSNRSGKSLTAGSSGGHAAGGNNNSKSSRNIVGINVQMAIEAERRERGLSAATVHGGSRRERNIHSRSLERGHNRSRSRSIGRQQQQRNRSIDNRDRDSGSQQNQQKADSTRGFYDNDDDPEQMIDPSMYTVGDSPNNNEVVGTGGENPLDASTRSEKRVSFQKPSTSSSRGSGMLALGHDNNLSPAEMEAERDPNISWRDGDTSDDGINNLDASHSSRTPHDHPHLEEEGRPTLANDKKKKKQQQKKKKTKRQFKGFIKKKKKSNNEMMPLDDGTSTRGKRSRKFYMCVALLLLVVGGIIAGIVYMIQEMTSTNNTDKNTSSTTKDETQLLNCHGMLYST